MTIPLSVLDLSPIVSGSNSSQALQNTLDLARRVEELGYTRYWLAEHHNMPGLASAAPEIVIGHVAQVTTRLRVGSGGVMLPNHVPLHVVETFRVLEAFHPGRIDLGIGRAPGTDPLTAYALRKAREAGADNFPEQMAELLAFAQRDFPDDHPFQTIRAMPDDVPLPPIWLLGSSGYSAQMAAQMGVGFAFAHHINPDNAIPALRAYRERFEASSQRGEPYAILALGAICAETDAEAEELATSMDLVRLRLEQGRFEPLPSPAEAQAYPYTAVEQTKIRGYRARLILGSPATVHARISALLEESGADELMVVTMVHDHAARRRSYELLAGVFGL